MNKNDIIVIHGTDYKEMAKKVMEAADVAGRIGDRSTSIGLKPNLVTSSTPESGATTHAELLCGAIEYLQEHGFQDITIMEGSWVGEITPNAFRTAGYDQVIRKYGVPFYDLQKDSWTEYDARGMKIKLCDKAAGIGFMINMPVLKGHCQTIVTCALKNNKGVIPNQEKRRFHTLGLHKPIAHLNTIAKNDFILVDNICGDLDFEEGGNPVQMDRVLGFLDPVLCDTFVCESMGYEKDDIEYIVLAEKLGVGSTDLEHANIIYLNEPVAGRSMKKRTRRVEALERYIEADDACSACYGSLIYAMDRLNDRGMLGRGTKKVCIGQGFRGKTGDIGVGACTSCFNRTLGGCPPKAKDMLEFLQKNL